MTPLQIEILVHYYGCANDYRNGDFSAPAVREAIDWFKGDAGMLEPIAQPKYPHAVYKLTEKGRFFVDYICSLPLPINTWAMYPVKK